MRRPHPIRELRRLGRFTMRETTVVGASFLAGAVLVAVGVGMVFLPAGLIVLGAELIASSVLYTRGAS